MTPLGRRGLHAGRWLIVREDLGDARGDADGNAELPGEIVISQRIENQPRTSGAKE